MQGGIVVGRADTPPVAGSGRGMRRGPPQRRMGADDGPESSIAASVRLWRTGGMTRPARHDLRHDVR